MVKFFVSFVNFVDNIEAPMNRKILCSLALIAQLFIISRAHALVQDQPQPMSLQACVQEARNNNRGLRASHARVVAAEAKASEAFSAILPQVRLSSRFAQLSDIDPFSFTAPGFGAFTLFPNIDHSYSARVSLQQPVFTGFRLLKNLEAARLNATATGEDFTRDERDLTLEVKTMYWNLVRARQVEGFLKQTVEQVSEHLRDVENFYTQGLATQNDVYKVEVQLADVRVKLIEAESNRRLVNMSLNNLMGKPLETSIVPTEDPEIPGRVGESIDTSSLGFPSAFLHSAQNNRPELKALRLRKGISEANLGAARAGWLPQVALTAGYDYARPNQRIIPPKDEWRGTWDVGLTVQWSVWDWFTTAHQTTQARAALIQAEEGLAQLENAVAMQVTRYYLKMHEAVQKRLVSKRGVEQATESYRITNEKFRRGLMTNTDLLDAEVALLQSKLTQTQANIDYQIAYAQLVHAAGFSESPSGVQ